MKVFFVVLLFICLGFDVQAADIVIHVGSAHAEAGYNGSNPGLGVRSHKPDYYFGAGAYHNSLNRTSVYAGVGKRVFNMGVIDLRLSAGMITGYAKPITPFIIPELALIVNKRVAMMASYIPAVEFGDLKTVAAIGFSLEIKAQ